VIYYFKKYDKADTCMSYDPAVHHRRSIRLQGYDYSLIGSYFITICTYNHDALFGEIDDGAMQLNEIGQIIYLTWLDLVNHIPNIELGPFVIMPNHIHGIVNIIDRSESVSVGMNREDICERSGTGGLGSVRNDKVRAGLEPAPTGKIFDGKNLSHSNIPVVRTSLSEIVRQFKTFSARKVNEFRKTQGVPFWQRNYYEHIIRDEQSYLQIAQYILDNPILWEKDQLYPGKNS
jgi:REP element-mobilizing transposase RayT